MHGNVNVFGLGGIDLLCCFCAAGQVPRLATANISTDMLLWACNNAAAYITYMSNSHV